MKHLSKIALLVGLVSCSKAALDEPVTLSTSSFEARSIASINLPTLGLSSQNLHIQNIRLSQSKTEVTLISAHDVEPTNSTMFRAGLQFRFVDGTSRFVDLLIVRPVQSMKLLFKRMADDHIFVAFQGETRSGNLALFVFNPAGVTLHQSQGFGSVFLPPSPEISRLVLVQQDLQNGDFLLDTKDGSVLRTLIGQSNTSSIQTSSRADIGIVQANTQMRLFNMQTGAELVGSPLETAALQSNEPPSVAVFADNLVVATQTIVNEQGTTTLRQYRLSDLSQVVAPVRSFDTGTTSWREYLKTFYTSQGRFLMVGESRIDPATQSNVFNLKTYDADLRMTSETSLVGISGFAEDSDDTNSIDASPTSSIVLVRFKGNVGTGSPTQHLLSWNARLSQFASRLNFGDATDVGSLKRVERIPNSDRIVVVSAGRSQVLDITTLAIAKTFVQKSLSLVNASTLVSKSTVSGAVSLVSSSSLAPGQSCSIPKLSNELGDRALVTDHAPNRLRGDTLKIQSLVGPINANKSYVCSVVSNASASSIIEYPAPRAFDNELDARPVVGTLFDRQILVAAPGYGQNKLTVLNPGSLAPHTESVLNFASNRWCRMIEVHTEANEYAADFVCQGTDADSQDLSIERVTFEARSGALANL
jgi:hypothetical protein